jgi:dTDP-4-dehydrorhamnose reductase
MSVLLTGGNGQLGWEMLRRAPARKIDVRGFAHRDLDITDLDALNHAIQDHRPKVVINAAAYTAVDKAESDGAAAFAVNRDGPKNLAQICARSNVPLIHISTDYVFDGSKAGAYTETDPVAPLGVYGASKLAGENAVRDSGARHIILRTAWVYSSHGNNFVKTMLRLGAERDVLRVVDDQRGSPTYAADLADAVLTLTERLMAGQVAASGFGTFHCVGSGETTWCNFARQIFAKAHLAKTPKVEAITTAEYPTPARRPANSVLATAKLAQTHGITLRPWLEALADMLALTAAA